MVSMSRMRFRAWQVLSHLVNEYKWMTRQCGLHGPAPRKSKSGRCTCIIFFSDDSIHLPLQRSTMLRKHKLAIKKKMCLLCVLLCPTRCLICRRCRFCRRIFSLFASFFSLRFFWCVLGVLLRLARPHVCTATHSFGLLVLALSSGMSTKSATLWRHYERLELANGNAVSCTQRSTFRDRDNKLTQSKKRKSQ